MVFLEFARAFIETCQVSFKFNLARLVVLQKYNQKCSGFIRRLLHFIVKLRSFKVHKTPFLFRGAWWKIKRQLDKVRKLPAIKVQK